MATLNNVSLSAPLMAQVQSTADAEKRSTDDVVVEAVKDYLRRHPRPVATGVDDKLLESLVQQERRERLARS